MAEAEVKLENLTLSSTSGTGKVEHQIQNQIKYF